MVISFTLFTFSVLYSFHIMSLVVGVYMDVDFVVFDDVRDFT